MFLLFFTSRQVQTELYVPKYITTTKEYFD